MSCASSPAVLRSPLRGALALGLTGATALVVLPGEAHAVVGGHPIQVQSVPWVVQVATKRAQSCTGSLIRPRIVLTAAHCLILGDDPTRVVVGRQKANGTGGREIAIAKGALDRTYARAQGRRYSRGPDRRTRLVSDVALLELAEPVTDVAPVALAGPEHAGLLFPGQRPLIAGWGLAGDDREDLTRITARRELRGAVVPTRSSRWCVSRLRARDGSSRGVVCVGRTDTPTPGGCYGDSGGPLYQRTAAGPVQLGVASEIEPAGCGKGATLYVKVLAGTARTFIDRHITPGGFLRGGVRPRGQSSDRTAAGSS